MIAVAGVAMRVRTHPIIVHSRASAAIVELLQPPLFQIANSKDLHDSGTKTSRARATVCLYHRTRGDWTIALTMQ